jgi:hypothetical protein
VAAAAVAFLGGLITPNNLENEAASVVKQSVAAAVTGITGGAMLAFVAATMLPAAFERSGRDGSLSGMLCTVCRRPTGPPTRFLANT